MSRALQYTYQDIEGKKPVSAVETVNDLPWMELCLPQPPSVNRFMGKLGNRSPVVKAWSKQADMAFMVACIDNRAANRCFTKIVGPFETVVIFERDKSDFHNRLKPLFDWLQRVELIQNDRFCERLVSLWGPRGSGCLVRLRPFMEVAAPPTTR